MLVMAGSTVGSYREAMGADLNLKGSDRRRGRKPLKPFQWSGHALRRQAALAGFPPDGHVQRHVACGHKCASAHHQACGFAQFDAKPLAVGTKAINRASVWPRNICKCGRCGDHGCHQSDTHGVTIPEKHVYGECFAKTQGARLDATRLMGDRKAWFRLRHSPKFRTASSFWRRKWRVVPRRAKLPNWRANMPS